MKVDPQKKYEQIKKGSIYEEEIHCPMIIEVMSDPKQSTVAAFCVKAGIGQRTFYEWTNRIPLFEDCYEFGKMLARYNWEKEADDLERLESGEVGCKYELWRLKGWSQFGVGKNSRIRINLTEKGSPAQHYQDILKSAAKGEYTAGEIKQLMEAINVGLNAHQAFELQKQIDEIKKNQDMLDARTNG